MESPEAIDIPGQFEITDWFTLAVRDGVTNPIPASGDLPDWADNSDEYFQSTEIFLRSPYTRDILDGAIAAAMLGSHDGEELIPLFEGIIDDCHNAQRWKIIEPVEGCTLESTLFMIEIDLLLALKEIRSPMGLPLALRALSDSEDGLHTFAIDVINNVGPNATDAIPDLVRYIETEEPAGLPKDHFDYRRSLRCDACEVLGAIGTPEAVSSLRRVIEGKLPQDVREAARKAIDELFESSQ